MTKKTQNPRRGQAVRLVIPLLLASFALVACHDSSPTEPLAPGIDWNSCGAGDICGSGNVIQEERPVSGVTGVLLSSIGDLHIRQGGGEALRLEGEDNLLPYLRTEVQGGILNVWTDGNVDLSPTAPIDLYLTVAGLESVEVTGVGDVDAPDLTTDRLDVRLTGVGDLDFPGLEAEELEVTLAGVGDMNVSGNVVEQRIAISGAADYNARELRSTRAEVRITGSGSATVWATDRLVVSITGTGSVYYAGDPALVSSVTGSGRIVHLGS
jgi:hypothetical protein